MSVNMASGAAIIGIQFESEIEKTKAALAYRAGKPFLGFNADKARSLPFLADREHLLRFGRTNTGDSYEARNSGPVPVETGKSNLSQTLPLECGEEALFEKAEERALPMV